jgi:hypothetical protein
LGFSIVSRHEPLVAGFKPDRTNAASGSILVTLLWLEAEQFADRYHCFAA